MTLDPEQPLHRKTQESIQHTQKVLADTKDAGFAILDKIRNQGSMLRASDDRLTPIFGMSGETGKLIKTIQGSMSSGRRLFAVLVVLTVLILYFVIKWKG